MKRDTRGRIWLLASAVLALTAAVTVTATLALFTATPLGATNSLTLGNVGGEIAEDGWAGTPKQIASDAAVAKTPKVKNTGTLPVYARILVAGGTDYFWFSTTGAAGCTKKFEALYNGVPGTKWQYNTADGYYYYIGGEDGVLVSGESTEALFTYVKLKDDFNGTSDNLDLIVYAEVVQTIDYDTGKPFVANVVNPTPFDNAKAAFAALKEGGGEQ